MPKYVFYGESCVNLLPERSCHERKRNDVEEKQEKQMGMKISEECVSVKNVRWKRRKLIIIEFKS